MNTAAGVCSGVGGFDLAFDRAGFEIIWGCERDASCRSVLAAHFPNVTGFLDMLGDDILAAPAPDVFFGGTPCQGFSVAGLRKGLNDDRSNLALRFIQLCDHFNPRVILWENVPGVLSDKENAFGCFLAGLVGADAPLVPPAECGGRWTNAGLVAGPRRTAAWRILDSQYFGVAQRRERVFVVASPRAELPFQVLFEPEGLRRHFAPSREKKERVAPTLEGCAGRSGCNSFATSGGLAAFGGNNGGGDLEIATACNAHGGTGRHDFESETFVCSTEISQPLLAKGNCSHRDDAETYVAQTVGPLTACGGTDRKHGYGAGQQEAESGNVIPVVTHALRADGFDASEDGTGRGTPIVPCLTSNGDAHSSFRDEHGLVPMAFQSKASANQSMNPGEISPALDVGKSDGVAVCCAFKPGQGGKARSLSVSEDLSPTLESADAGNNKPAVAFSGRWRGAEPSVNRPERPPLTMNEQVGALDATKPWNVAQGYAVRRLTPTECERLQAFPDGWTAVTNPRGKPMADGPRYKMMGNAVSVCVVQFLAERIMSALTNKPL